MKDPIIDKQLPLFIPHSHTSTAVNKTGSWRFFHPRYADKTAPCSAACPVGQDIARIETLTSWGLLEDAWQLILRENPLPAVCGRVCFHPCESACNRGNLDAPLAIHHLERFLGDTALSKAMIPDPVISPARAQRVAIAGAGPAGLSAAYFLTRLGYRCEVFEAESVPGGMLSQGIPGYRLPRDVLDREIKRIENQGATIHCDQPVTADRLEKICEAFDALFVGCGDSRSITLKIDGGHLADDGLDFLRRLHQGEAMSFTGQAVVFDEHIDPKLQIAQPVGAIHIALGTEFVPFFIAHQRIEKLFGHLRIQIRTFELDQITIDTIGGRSADLEMQVRNPHRTVFLEVIQHIQNAEMTLFFGRIYLRRSRIVFCHSHLLWC